MGKRQALAGSSGFWAVFILCNGEREDEGRQDHTHATCHSTGAATPMVRRRTESLEEEHHELEVDQLTVLVAEIQLVVVLQTTAGWRKAPA